MKSAVTISLVSEASSGPFVFHEDLSLACETAKLLGFDAIELFAPDSVTVPLKTLHTLLSDNGLKLAAVGTGAGWVRHKLTLSSPDRAIRKRALEFVDSMQEFAGAFQAPVIIGSMQGRWGDDQSKSVTLELLGDSLLQLSDKANSFNTCVLYEPLNRYETNLINRLDEGTEFVKSLAPNIKLLADLFHMAIEEVNLAEAIRTAGPSIGHVHLADSNRRPAGYGHTDFTPIASALKEIGYSGYLSAEAFPYPDSHAAAEATIDCFRKHFRL